MVWTATIARDECVALLHSVELYSILYGQNYIAAATDRRADCSGWQSYGWGLPKTGPGTYLNAFTTQSMWEQGVIREIPRADLRPGDAIGYCGPGTANGGGGHIAPFLEAAGARVRVIDHGSGMGPKDRWVTWDGDSTGWLAPGKCKAWRYVGMLEEGEDMGVLAQVKGSPAVYYCDGMTRRWVRSEQELADIREAAKLGLIPPLRNGGNIYQAARLEGLGLVIGPEPGVSPAPPAGAVPPHTHDFTGAVGAVRDQS